jgi:hypothetical protein
VIGFMVGKFRESVLAVRTGLRSRVTLHFILFLSLGQTTAPIEMKALDVIMC